MPRSVSTAMLNALAAPVLNPAIFVSAQFITATVYMWSGIGTIFWNGHIWFGLGAFLGITAPEDSSTVEAKGITLTLSGIDSTLLPDALNEVQLGLPVTVYLALGTSAPVNAGNIITSPVVMWQGRMDQPSFSVNAEEVTLNINCENRLLDMNIAVDRRYTNQDQQISNPGDNGFLCVDAIEEVTLYWGSYPASSNNL